MTRLMRLPEVLQHTGLPRSTLYARINSGTFPRPVKISERSSAWQSDLIQEWIEGRIKASPQVA
jgi:prophage regulatory protein